MFETKLLTAVKLAAAFIDVSGAKETAGAIQRCVVRRFISPYRCRCCGRRHSVWGEFDVSHCKV